MAIDDNTVCVLGECLTDSGGRYQFKSVVGANGRESFLIEFRAERTSTPRFVIVKGYAVRPLMRALTAFTQRDPARPENAGSVPPPPKPEPAAKPPVNAAMADALAAALRKRE